MQAYCNLKGRYLAMQTTTIEKEKRKQALLEETGQFEFTIVTAYSTDYSAGRICEKINHKYAKTHGYGFICECIPKRKMLDMVEPRKHCTWYKILLLRRLLAEKCYQTNQKEAYLMWIDADAIVINHGKSLDEIVHLAGKKELIVGEDTSKCCPLNAGVLLVRVCDYNLGLFNEIWKSNAFMKYYSKPFYEQSAIIRLLKKRKEGLEAVRPYNFRQTGPLIKHFPHSCVLAKHLLNSDVYNTDSKSDPEAHFIFHPAGGKNKLRKLNDALNYFGISIENS